MLVHCWSTVYDIDLTWPQHWVNVSCLLGCWKSITQTTRDVVPILVWCRGGQVNWVLSPQMATFRCFEWSFFNIYITDILFLSPHVAMWRPLAQLCNVGPTSVKPAQWLGQYWIKSSFCLWRIVGARYISFAEFNASRWIVVIRWVNIMGLRP